MIKIETYKAAKSLTALKEAGNEIKQASNLTEWLRFVLEVYAASTYFAPPTESVPMGKIYFLQTNNCHAQ